MVALVGAVAGRTGTLGSATAAVVADGGGRVLERDGSARWPAGPVEDLLHRRLVCLFDQPGSQVLLQGLVRGGGALAQDGVGALRHVLDLNAGHGAIMAPMAPECKLGVLARGCRASRGRLGAAPDLPVGMSGILVRTTWAGIRGDPDRPRHVSRAGTEGASGGLQASAVRGCFPRSK